MCAFEKTATHLQGFGAYKALSHALVPPLNYTRGTIHPCKGSSSHYCEGIKTRELWFTGQAIGRRVVERGP